MELLLPVWQRGGETLIPAGANTLLEVSALYTPEKGQGSKETTHWE